MGASISVAPALFLLIIAAIAALFYYIYYKNKINRALENGEDAESAGLEPASFTKTALIAVLIIILIIMLFRISSLRSQLTDMENKLNNGIRRTEHTQRHQQKTRPAGKHYRRLFCQLRQIRREDAQRRDTLHRHAETGV